MFPFQYSALKFVFVCSWTTLSRSTIAMNWLGWMLNPPLEAVNTDEGPISVVLVENVRSTKESDWLVSLTIVQNGLDGIFFRSHSLLPDRINLFYNFLLIRFDAQVFYLRMLAKCIEFVFITLIIYPVMLHEIAK